MISLLNGTIVDLSLDRAVVMVGGVGFSVSLTHRHAIKLAVGQEISLQTKLVVREDDLSLYGFESQTDASYFDLLCSVSGIGPKLAMTILGDLILRGLRMLSTLRMKLCFVQFLVLDQRPRSCC